MPLTAVPVVAANEVYLGGVRFPIKGPVRVTNIAVTPNPIVLGDTSRQSDSQVMSQYIQSSNQGGLGIYKANPRIDTDRFWDSRADTRWRGLLSLPPLAVDMGRPAGSGSDAPILSASYRNVEYFVFGTKIYPWDDATPEWDASERTFSSTPVDTKVWKDRLYVSYGHGSGANGLDYRNNAGTWTNDAAAGAAFYLEVWDGKLWNLRYPSGSSIYTDWRLRFTLDGTTWTDAALFPTGVIPHGLFVYRTALGDNVLYVPSDSGLWIYDAVTDRWLETELQVPKLPSNQAMRTTIWRDGRLFFTSGGLGVYAVQSGNPFVVTPIGLDLDDGLPQKDTGQISGFASDLNWVLALIAGATVSTAPDDTWTTMGGPFESDDWEAQLGLTTLRAWNNGWHTLWESPAPGSGGSSIEVSSAYDKRRVYWATNDRFYYFDIPTGIYNPRQNPTPAFAEGPVRHVTSWFDLGTEGQDKLLGRLLLRTSKCSSTEKVTVYYGTDLDDNEFIQLGEITADGLWKFKPNDSQGVQLRFVRFAFDLERGADSSKSPLVEFWAAEYMRLLPATYGFAFQLDLSKDLYAGRTPAQLVDAIKILTNPAETPNLIQFAYLDEDTADVQTHFVKITKLTGSEFPGRSLRGQGEHFVSVIAPYHEDSL